MVIPFSSIAVHAHILAFFLKTRKILFMFNGCDTRGVSPLLSPPRSTRISNGHITLQQTFCWVTVRTLCPMSILRDKFAFYKGLIKPLFKKKSPQLVDWHHLRHIYSHIIFVYPPPIPSSSPSLRSNSSPLHYHSIIYTYICSPISPRTDPVWSSSLGWSYLWTTWW